MPGRDRISAGNRKGASHGAARVVLASIFAALGLALSTPARAQTTITVTDLGDPTSTATPPGCTLRDAINIAQGGSASGSDSCNSSGSGSPYTIVFSLIGTIALGSTLPPISVSGDLTITGPTTSPGITIDGGGKVELMLSAVPSTCNF
jgi:hypothetical protein